MLTDFHAHVLPCVDDGSRSLEESVSMITMEAEQGIKHVVATPHFYAHHDKLDLFLRRREDAFAQLKSAIADNTDYPTLSLGAEVYFFPGISDSELISYLTIDNGKYILLEMPVGLWTESMYTEIENIWNKQGIIPIIAHIDRYIAPFQTNGIPQRLAQLPVLVQANASFFLRRQTARYALNLFHKDMIHLIGSDCHNLSDRAPNLGMAVDAIKRRFGIGELQRVSEYEADVLK